MRQKSFKINQNKRGCKSILQEIEKKRGEIWNETSLRDRTIVCFLKPKKDLPRWPSAAQVWTLPNFSWPAAEVWTGCLFLFRQRSNFGSRCLNGHCRQIHTILRSPFLLEFALLQVSKEQDRVEPDSGLGIYQISEEIKVHLKIWV